MMGGEKVPTLESMTIKLLTEMTVNVFQTLMGEDYKVRESYDVMEANLHKKYPRTRRNSCDDEYHVMKRENLRRCSNVREHDIFMRFEKLRRYCNIREHRIRINNICMCYRFRKRKHEQDENFRKYGKRELEKDENEFSPLPKRPRLRSEGDNRKEIINPYHSLISQEYLSMYSDSTDIKLELVKSYFSSLPTTCWGQYSDLLLKKIIKGVKIKALHCDSLQRIIEYVVGEKLVKFSTEWIKIMIDRDPKIFMTEDENKDLRYSYYRAEDAFFNRLMYCSNLQALEFTLSAMSDKKRNQLKMALQRLQNLRSLHLVHSRGFSGGITYEWLIDPIGRQCNNLRELKILYDGDNLLRPQSSISCLKNLKNLRTLWLFNYGRQSELESLTELLKTLNVKILFHKELPHAVRELTKKTFKVLKGHSAEGEPESKICCKRSIKYVAKRNYDLTPIILDLERIDLYSHGHGHCQLVKKIPTSYLFRIAETCPNLSLINLIGSRCLLQVVKKLPHLQTIMLQKASLALSLRCTLKHMQLDKLRVLRVSDVWDVTYEMFTCLANSCANLQELSISSSSLTARGRLILPTERAPFSQLQHLTLVPGVLNNDPKLSEYPNPLYWELGADLTKFVLHNATQLSYIHLHYKKEDLTLEDMPTKEIFEEALCMSRPSLKRLYLMYPPEISRNIVDGLMEACPNLETLGGVKSWGLSPADLCALIYSEHLDIC